MTPYYQHDRATLYRGDCISVMAELPECSVDSVVTDPPYGLSFMGKDWDHGVPGEHFWSEVLRVAKPGAHLLAFGGTRTFHRLACAIEGAGWEIRDCVMWVYGSGFPKSLDVSKATDAAKQWAGFGTALKPAWEPVIVARKPLVGTVAENVLRYGTGGINVDGCRVPSEKQTGWGGCGSALYEGGLSREGGDARLQDKGRWPANLCHDGSAEVVGLFPVTGAAKQSWRGAPPHYDGNRMADLAPRGHDDNGGSAARFFYCAKASKADRDEGVAGVGALVAGVGALRDGGRPSLPRKNHHPTVKPTDLMRYLCRLVTPPGGIVLDPFMGSGSTGKACMLEGFRFIGIDVDGEYVEIARRRISFAMTQSPLEFEYD